MKRAEQKEKRRKEILNAGLDLFIRKGCGATRTAEIADAVGMSEGLLFHYFETKEKLYLALIDIALSARENSFGFTGGRPIEFFETVASYIIVNCVRDNFFAKLFVLMNMAENDTLLSENLREDIKGGRELEETVELVKKGQSDGSIKNGDPLALALAFWASVNGIVENIARYPELPVPKPEWTVDLIRNIGRA